MSGRAALHSILREIARGSSRRVWLPTYLCPDILPSLPPYYSIAWYVDYPDEPVPDFASLSARPGDVVLIQDTFGLSDPSQWVSWGSDNPDVTLIEDITHHCTYSRFLQSPASRVFASLRKAIPVADGGLVFERTGSLRRVGTGENHGSLLKLEAMILKASYIQGHSINKQGFRDLQIRGEKLIAEAAEGPCLTHTAQALLILPWEQMARRWRDNNKRFVNNLSSIGIAEQVHPLSHRAAGDDGAVFHTVLKFRDQRSRDFLRSYLIERHIFPAIHWQFPKAQDGDGGRREALSNLLLTIPTDFRYNEDDIDKLSDMIGEGCAP